MDQIEPANVLEVLSPIWIRIPERARRIRQRTKVVFEWAKVSGCRSGDNPADGVSKGLPKHNTKQKHHAALPYSEVSAFIQVLHATTSVAVAIQLALEFLILTAARTSEVLLGKWTEIDLATKTWIVPAERMKAKVEHRVPLSARAIEILERAKQISTGGPYIFPGRSPKRPLSNMSMNMALRRMKRTDITVHGFRSSFREWAEERTNFTNSVVEAALAHTVKNKVEAAYLRTKLFDKRLKLWGEFATAAAAKVVRIRA